MLPDDENKEAETSGKEMLFAILYLNNSDKYRFPELKKRVKTTTFWTRQNTQGVLLRYRV